ncbi:lipid-A-disaccharide synthase [Sabulicella glaciei]|uniref:Lipid-A-disaccharide synthase n=1 Tax=Sabulicella glaciei TaxID=2984948 RepID=A0ABT3NS77_9PROT|nr:lipid-A-disaccharide synthase [Roseococcus sp. MDT2-1-1]MCW8085016.1 lipid-A-disaccharide synthase [Roseococcus sp. MDT2-1-1]
MSLVWIAAGEASGDILAARLVAALRTLAPGLRFAGIGGERMAEQGVESLFPIRELALMGLVEVLPQLRNLARRMGEAEDALRRDRPALLVTVDNPGFTLRLARRAKALGIPVVHYVAPQVWAWRPGRVRRMVGVVDRILALLPFEAPFFEQSGIPVEFVGHPILESEAAGGDAARFPLDGPGLLVMPGSRRGELRRHLPVFGAALPPGVTPVVALAGTVEEEVRAETASWGARYVRAPAEKADAMAACRAGLIKSGTSSLEAAVAGLPHVVAYRVNPVTAAIVRRLMRVRHASLVNLLAEEEVVPEFLQERCEPRLLRAALQPLIDDGAEAERQRRGFHRALEKLAPPGGGAPSAAAAEAVLRMLS